MTDTEGRTTMCPGCNEQTVPKPWSSMDAAWCPLCGTAYTGVQWALRDDIKLKIGGDRRRG